LLVDWVVKAFFDGHVVLLLASIASCTLFVLNHPLTGMNRRMTFFIDRVEEHSLIWIKRPIWFDLFFSITIIKTAAHKAQIWLLIPLTIPSSHCVIHFFYDFLFNAIFFDMIYLWLIIIRRFFNDGWRKSSIVCFAKRVVPELDGNYTGVIGWGVFDCDTFLHTLVIRFTLIDDAITFKSLISSGA